MNFHNIQSKDLEYPRDNPNLNNGSQIETVGLGVPKESSLTCNSSSNTDTESSHLDGQLLSSYAQQNNCGKGRITVDAVHPLFIGYRNVSRDVATSTDNQKYYCRQCNIYLDLLQEAIIDHFENISHQSIDLCVYCNCKVYEYFYNDRRIIYHKCNANERIDSSSNLTENGDVPLLDLDT